MANMNQLQCALLRGNIDNIELILKLVGLKKLDKFKRCRFLVNFLLEQKINVNINSTNYPTLLHFTVVNGDKESFNFLLENSDFSVNAVIPSTGTTLLHTVAMVGIPEMAKSLLERGANVNALSRLNLIPLHFACSNYMSDFRVGIISPRSYSSSSKKDAVIVKLLFDHGSNLEVEGGTYGETPLQFSCHGSGFLEAFEFLLQKGANIHVNDRFGENVLHKAVRSHHLGLIKIILDQDFDSKCKDTQGNSPIHKYFSPGLQLEDDYSAVLDILVKHGADVNSRNYRHNTPLHEGCVTTYCEYSLFKYFLKRNPDINALNKSGETPLNVALQVADLYPGVSSKRFMISRLEYLCGYIAKLEATDQYICQENLDLVKSDLRIKKLYQKFELEISKMKEVPINSSSDFCYFYILKASLQKLIVLLQNEAIMKSLASENYKEMFPLYASSLTDSIEEAIITRDLTQTCTFRLRKHVKRNLSHLIVDNIFWYLNTEDLKNFKEAFLNV